MKSSDPGYNRHQKLVKRYGITLAEYNEMLSRQDGKCAVCQQHRRLVVDHCHDDGKVRGLLCDNCNLGIGHFRHDPNLLLVAAMYCSEHKEKRELPDPSQTPAPAEPVSPLSGGVRDDASGPDGGVA